MGTLNPFDYEAGPTTCIEGFGWAVVGATHLTSSHAWHPTLSLLGAEMATQSQSFELGWIVGRAVKARTYLGGTPALVSAYFAAVSSPEVQTDVPIQAYAPNNQARPQTCAAHHAKTTKPAGGASSTPARHRDANFSCLSWDECAFVLRLGCGQVQPPYSYKRSLAASIETFQGLLVGLE